MTNREQMFASGIASQSPISCGVSGPLAQDSSELVGDVDSGQDCPLVVFYKMAALAEQSATFNAQRVFCMESAQEAPGRFIGDFSVHLLSILNCASSTPAKGSSRSRLELISWRSASLRCAEGEAKTSCFSRVGKSARFRKQIPQCRRPSNRFIASQLRPRALAARRKLVIEAF